MHTARRSCLVRCFSARRNHRRTATLGAGEAGDNHSPAGEEGAVAAAFPGVQRLVGGFKGPQAEVDRVVAVYRERRDRLVAGLNSLRGVSCRKPEGAFYAFPNVKGTGLPCRELAARLLDEVGVALLPGSDFGQYGDGYLRLSYATSLQNIDKALERMRAFLARV